MLTLQYIPYSEIESLDSDSRINKLLGIVKNERIILLEGKLTKPEETSLIKKTMEQISNSFKGIEIATIDAKDSTTSFKKILMNLIAGDRSGVTIIGPATIVKEIKKQPDKIQLFMQIPKSKSAGKTAKKKKQ